MQGDVMEQLKLLPDESVHVCITSPPYWSLRDYGTASWIGGDPECDHKKPGANKVQGNPEFNKNRPSREATDTPGYRETCGKCGAVREDNQIGMEDSVEEHIAVLVEVFREVRRVLRKDGLLWVNYGDCYCASPAGKASKKYVEDVTPSGTDGVYSRRYRNNHQGGTESDADARQKTYQAMRGKWKAKDLMLLPARLAIALCDDGWWLRSYSPWIKRTAMPESAQDRPSSALEYVFQLAKSERYYFDMEAVRLPSKIATPRRENGAYANLDREDKTASWLSKTSTHGQEAGRNWRNSDFWYETVGMLLYQGEVLGFDVIAEAYSEAHFACYPPSLVKPMILASTSEKGCCPKCGTGWRRVLKVREDYPQGSYHSHEADGVGYGRRQDGGPKADVGPRYEQTGWEPACQCEGVTEDDLTPAVVCDIFAGSGTTLQVAMDLGRHAIGIELNPVYVELMRKRIEPARLQETLLF